MKRPADVKSQSKVLTCMCGGRDTLASMHNCISLDGFAFSVLLNEDGAGHFELTKA